MRWIISVLVLLALLAGLWWMEQGRQAELAPEPEVDLPTEATQPQPRYPLPDSDQEPEPDAEAARRSDAPDNRREPDQAELEAEEPLPDLSESDEVALDALSDMAGTEFVERWVKPEYVITRSVTIINSLDGAAPALKTWPLNTLGSKPVTSEDEADEGDARSWRAANTERYAAAIATLDSITPEQAATHYRRYYPLFQQAWEELGENDPYFNDRLIDIIDHLLATPEVELPFEVVPYEGRLHFADEALQQESWGRKLLIRMGPDHARTIKTWLEGFRDELMETQGSSVPTP